MQFSRVLAPDLTWDRELSAVPTQCVCLLWAACHSWDFLNSWVCLVCFYLERYGKTPVLSLTPSCALCQRTEVLAWAQGHICCVSWTWDTPAVSSASNTLWTVAAVTNANLSATVCQQTHLGFRDTQVSEGIPGTKGSLEKVPRLWCFHGVD